MRTKKKNFCLKMKMNITGTKKDDVALIVTMTTFCPTVFITVKISIFLDFELDM